MRGQAGRERAEERLSGEACTGDTELSGEG
jgi:hypothetical protein